MRILILLIIVSSFHDALAQTDSVIDKRDGQKYATIVIGNKIWLREHLRFQSKLSHYPNFDKTNASLHRGNYYSNAELDSVCPQGWRVATIKDWEEYISYLVAAHKISSDSIITKTIPPPNSSVVITLKNLNVFKDSLLNLAPIGWVEGNKIANQTTLTLWVRDSSNSDNRYHVHIDPKGYVKHTHKHHVIDKPKRIRKFPVRCVCELKNL